MLWGYFSFQSSNVKIILALLTLKAFSLTAQGSWGWRDCTAWRLVSACGGLNQPLYNHTSVCSHIHGDGPITELYSLPWLELRKMAFVSGGLWCLQSHKGLPSLGSLWHGPHGGALAPKLSGCWCCRAIALKQPESQLPRSRGGSRVTLWKGHHHHPPSKRERESAGWKAPFCSISFFSRIRAQRAGGKFHTLMKQKGARKESR